MNQNQLAQLFDTSKQNIGQHISNILAEGELEETSVVKNYFTTAANGRPDYFDELLERIREIRASEKRFYQKMRDLFALSSDYGKTDKAMQMKLIP